LQDEWTPAIFKGVLPVLASEKVWRAGESAAVEPKSKTSSNCPPAAFAGVVEEATEAGREKEMAAIATIDLNRDITNLFTMQGGPAIPSYNRPQKAGDRKASACGTA